MLFCERDYTRAADMAACWTLFIGPFGYVWYLGEQVTRQFGPSFLVPENPPPHYPSFRTTRLAPLVNSCPITTRATLPQARVRIVDSSGIGVTEDLPFVTGEVGGLPLPAACTGLSWEETVHMFKVVEALQRKVTEMSKAFHVV